jgi:hypothetical protein
LCTQLNFFTFLLKIMPLPTLAIHLV